LNHSPPVSDGIAAGVAAALPSSSGTAKAGGSVSPAKTSPAAVTPSVPPSVIDPLYTPNETQKQEAGLVAKLPSEFPIFQWESMGAIAQQKVMEKSGLSPQDQWRLLNASTPLQVLSILNEIWDNAKSGLLTSGEASKITDQTLRYSDDRLRLANGDASYLPPLQKALWNRELDKVLGDLQDKAKGNTGGSPKTTPRPSSTPLPKPGPSPEIDAGRLQLYQQLSKKVADDLNIVERVKGFRTTYDALDAVFQNEKAIQRVSTYYRVPAAVLQTLLFREQRFIDIRDWVADILVGNGITKQSSTGVMQVTTKTAINAINYAVSNGYTSPNDLGVDLHAPLSYSNEHDRSLIWQQLKNDSDFNIEVASMIVRMNADNIAGNKDIAHYTPDEMRRLFTSYNGTGPSAKNYGEECYHWYPSFQLYHTNEEISEK
jgi:hypothetical protein